MVSPSMDNQNHNIDTLCLPTVNEPNLDYKEVVAASEKFDLLQNTPTIDNSKTDSNPISEEEMEALEIIRKTNHVRNISLGQKSIELFGFLSNADAEKRYLLHSKGWKLFYKDITGVSPNSTTCEKVGGPAVSFESLPESQWVKPPIESDYDKKFAAQIKSFEYRFNEKLKEQQRSWIDETNEIEKEAKARLAAVLAAGAERFGQVTGNERIRQTKSGLELFSGFLFGCGFGVGIWLLLQLFNWVTTHIKIV